MSCKTAIAALEQEIAAFGQGTKLQPPDGTTNWFLLRAKVCGLQMLKAMDKAGVAGDPARAEEFYRAAGKEMKHYANQDGTAAEAGR